MLHLGCSSNPRSVYATSLHSIKCSGYKIGVNTHKGPLTLEQNNYLTKVVNSYIVYGLDAWARNCMNAFKLKNFLLAATNVVTNSDKEKWVTMYGVGSNSSSQTDDHKNNSLILGEGLTYGINGGFGLPEKNLSKSRKKLLVLAL